MNTMPLAEIAARLRCAPAWQRKHEIDALTHAGLQQVPWVKGAPVYVGDDAAAIRHGDGYLLLAAEVIYPPLVQADPYLAGRCAILANVNDVYAMGGRPLAIVDTILAPDTELAAELMRGLKDGCDRYGIALVGGHVTANSSFGSVAVSILGEARSILSCFDACPGDVLLHVTRMEGRFHPTFAFWDCSAHLMDHELRRDLELLPALAEAKLCSCARDVSMAGIIGSTMMLLEPSGVGAVLNLDAIPLPPGIADRYLDWLLSFPSYGFILAAHPQHVAEIQAVFTDHGIVCVPFGRVEASSQVKLVSGQEQIVLWDFATEPFTGFANHKCEEDRHYE